MLVLLWCVSLPCLAALLLPRPVARELTVPTFLGACSHPTIPRPNRLAGGGKSSSSYEPLLLENEREAVADLLDRKSVV